MLAWKKTRYRRPFDRSTAGYDLASLTRIACRKMSGIGLVELGSDSVKVDPTDRIFGLVK